MKGSVITSVAMHGLLLVWLLVSFGSPEPFVVTASEALPVELVPIEEMTQLQQGDKEAPKKEESATEVTKREDKVDNAVNNGDNNFDLKSVPTPTEKPDNIQKAAAPEKSEKVLPQQDVKPENVEEIIKEETQVEPATELAAKAEPKVEVKPEPKPEPEVKEEAPVEEAKAEPVPDNVPVPVTRPKVTEVKKPPEKTEEKKKEVEVAEAKTAKTQDRKKDEKNKKSAKSTTQKDSDFNSDQISELLNKTDVEAGGAKRNKKNKAFGAEKATGGQKLSQDEMSALRGLIEKNWSIMPGQVSSNDIVITVRFELDENGELVGRPEVTGTGGDDGARQALERGAVRAVMRSAPFDQLPKDKYDTWKVVTVNFQPSDMM
ncbi:cell envelope integrity protein TolA [Rhizobium sp. KVB221]|uniref:Cell envelope integrity protein TolA n=1 Tax=Rhizobium setariae TaxID=2801340 RepID=A0A937CPF8_9HYPH|nr:cell envelope integrity protein TolA [Rhizobium setariae]MBL0372458.1 cell envelope integrity protein TolA [Rhizobium setariae]